MRILIVEDEKKLARAISRTLKNEGYAIDIEYNSSEGYAMASTQPYDALIIELNQIGRASCRERV